VFKIVLKDETYTFLNRLGLPLRKFRKWEKPTIGILNIFAPPFSMPLIFYLYLTINFNSPSKIIIILQILSSMFFHAIYHQKFLFY